MDRGWICRIVAANIFIAVLLRNMFNYRSRIRSTSGACCWAFDLLGHRRTSYRGGHITVDLVWANVGPKYSA